MPQDFLFDIGNVILRFDFSVAVRELSDRSSRSTEDPLKAIGEVKNDLESGQIDDGTFIARSIDILGFEGSPEEFARIWCEIFELNSPMVPIIQHLSAAGHRLYLLSNTSGLHKDYFFDTYPIFETFRDGVYSHTARSMKPDEGIFRQAFDAFDLTPESTVYIDDHEDNIAAGQRLGLRSILYHPDHHDQVLTDLKAAGVDLEGC